MKGQVSGFDSGQMPILFEDDAEIMFKTPKRQKRNPLGEDCQLHADGSVTRDEDLIVKLQQRWKHQVYKPGGMMYKKVMRDFEATRETVRSLEAEFAQERGETYIPLAPDIFAHISR